MQSYNVYNTNFNKLAAWLIPKHLRKSKYALLVKACLYPLITLHNSFLRYRDTKIYQLTITSQVCYLERMLNDKYDSSQRRIYIKDAVWHLPFFVYMEAENKPQYLFKESEGKPIYVYKDGEAGAALNDFVVWVPSAVSFDAAEMKGMINSYYLFGTRYTIQVF